MKNNHWRYSIKFSHQKLCIFSAQYPYMIGQMHKLIALIRIFITKIVSNLNSDSNMKEKLSNIRVRYDYGFQYLGKKNVSDQKLLGKSLL